MPNVGAGGWFYVALSGLYLGLGGLPKALPWANLLGPFRPIEKSYRANDLATLYWRLE